MTKMYIGISVICSRLGIFSSDYFPLKVFFFAQPDYAFEETNGVRQYLCSVFVLEITSNAISR